MHEEQRPMILGADGLPMGGSGQGIMNNEAALRVIGFVECLKHVRSPWTGKPFKLLPWQHQVLSDVYGTMTERVIRKYQTCYLEIPKKNGKTELGAALALYHLFADGEQYGEIYGCAADRANAVQCFDTAVGMIDQCPALKKRCKLKISQKEIYDTVSHSFYKALSAEAFSKHGLNLSACIFDELHTQPNRELWDVMTSYAGDSREQPMWYVITTAGDDPDRHSIGWEIHEKARQIIAGERIEPTWYCKIYGIEPDYEGDIYDEELWYRVNPSLGYTIDIEKVRQAALSARNSEAEERLFRWLRLNQWISTKQVGWLPLPLWDETAAGFCENDLIGKRCYLGLDLSSTQDITAAVALFPPDDDCDKWRFLNYAWCPQEGIRERSQNDHVPYEKWCRDGFLQATPGDVVDYRVLAANLERICRIFDVQHIMTDPWMLQYQQQLWPEWMQEKVVEVPQTIAGMCTSMKELERMFLAHEIQHAKNPLGRWAFGNTRIATDGNANAKPMKNKSIEKIDPTVALINAMAGAIRLEPSRSIYESRGMRVV